MHRGSGLYQVSPTNCGDAGGGVRRRGMTMRPMMYEVLRLRCPAYQCDDVARLVVVARAPGWGRHQARLAAGARHERTLDAVACKRLFGADAPPRPGLRAPPPDDARTPCPPCTAPGRPPAPAPEPCAVLTPHPTALR
jgi:hypothetical protein